MLLLSSSCFGQLDSGYLVHAKYYSVFHEEYASITKPLLEKILGFTESEFLSSNGFHTGSINQVVFVRVKSASPYVLCSYVVGMYMGRDQTRIFNNAIDNDSFEIVEPQAFKKIKEQYMPSATSWFDLIPDSMNYNGSIPTLCIRIVAYAGPFKKIYKMAGFLENDFISFYNEVILNHNYLNIDFGINRKDRIKHLSVSGLDLQELYRNRKKIKKGKYHENVCQEIRRY